MLLFSLRLGRKVFHPIFIAICGIVSSFLAVFKSATKKNFEKFSLDDLKFLKLKKLAIKPDRLSEVHWPEDFSVSGESEEEEFTEIQEEERKMSTP